MTRGPVPSPRAVRVLVTLAVLIAIAVVAWLFFQVASLSIEAKAAREREQVASGQRNQLATTVGQQGQAIAEANRRLRDAGKQPVNVPQVVAPIEVPLERIEQAVAAYLKSNPPKDGRDAPTVQQVLARVTPEVRTAVAAYLSDNPPGDGHDGADGQNGKDGAPGSDGADGSAGPAPSDEQVAAAVAAYCDANEQCQGPTGPQGEPGHDGADSTVPGPQGEKGDPGAAAYPFTFSFVVQVNPVQTATYTCTVADPSTPAVCTKQ